MDQRCEAFHTYNFQDDEQFLAGWGKIQDQLAGSDPNYIAERLLHAKLFYFSRFHGPLTAEDYSSWLSTFSQHETQDNTNKEQEGIADSATSPSMAVDTAGTDSEQGDRTSLSLSVAGTASTTGATAAVASGLNQLTLDGKSKSPYPDGYQMENAINENRENLSVLNSNPNYMTSSGTGPQASGGNADSTTAGLQASASLSPQETSPKNAAVSTSRINNGTEESTSTIASNENSIDNEKKWTENHPHISKESENSGNSDIDSDICSSAGHVVDNETTNTEAPYPTSFWEIMQFVERGEPIPGVEELNIEATNEAPTESKAEKVKKPWER